MDRNELERHNVSQELIRKHGLHGPVYGQNAGQRLHRARDQVGAA